MYTRERSMLFLCWRSNKNITIKIKIQTNSRSNQNIFKLLMIQFYIFVRYMNYHYFVCVLSIVYIYLFGSQKKLRNKERGEHQIFHHHVGLTKQITPATYFYASLSKKGLSYFEKYIKPTPILFYQLTSQRISQNQRGQWHQ